MFQRRRDEFAFEKRVIVFDGKNIPPVVRLARERIEPKKVTSGVAPQIFTPGQTLTEASGFIRGHGTYLHGDTVKVSVAGVPLQINKLLIVRPIKNRYGGDVGDIVVGRITEVQMKRWKVDINARLDSVLLLSSVNLPGGELRRRSAEDEAAMRQYLQEGDLISAEVHQLFSDGCLSLQTRSTKCGKLGQGVLVKVFPALVKRHKTHFHDFPWGVSVILGNNGYIFVHPTAVTEIETEEDAYECNVSVRISHETRENVARVRNCILALAYGKIMLCGDSIFKAFQISSKYKVAELLTPKAVCDLVDSTQKYLREHFVM